MRDHSADRRSSAKQKATDRYAVKAFLKVGAIVPANGRIQDRSIESSAQLQVSELVAAVEDHGEDEHPTTTVFRVVKIEPGAGGNPVRWLTVERVTIPPGK